MLKSPLSWNDILLLPQYSEVRSRLDTDISTKLSRNIAIDIPVIATNMTTITGVDMGIAMKRLGGAAILPRFFPSQEEYIVRCKEYIALLSKLQGPTCISVGINGIDREVVTELISSGKLPDLIFVDVAHADCVGVVDMLKWLLKHTELDDVDIAVGNIATAAAAKRFCDLGVDALRCGIGGGSACSTRLVTGYGYPTLASVQECSEVADEYGIPIWADGGVHSSGAAVKALAFGASCVSIGAVLAATSETPGEVLEVEGVRVKKYWGMSSKEAMELKNDGLRKDIAPEGVCSLVPLAGDTEDVVRNFCGGIRSGLTYSGAKTIEELQSKVQYVVLTPGAVKESKY